MKNILFYFSVICIAFVFNGCFQRHPLPYAYETWEKQDAPYFRTEAQKKTDEIEVFKALLECGYESPFGDATNDYNKIITMDRCMIKAKFVESDRSSISVNEFCKKYPNPACNLPLSQIPDRNISMRLNSKWCTKLYPQADACQP